MQKFSPRITAASVHTLCNLIPVGRQCQRLIMLWKAWGWGGGGWVLPCVRRFPFWFNFKFGTRVCVRVCPSLTDGDDVRKCVCHMPWQPTPPGCVGGDTLYSVWHAAGCRGLSRGSGADHTMMCFMGNNVDTPPHCPWAPLGPRDIWPRWMSSVAAFPLRVSLCLWSDSRLSSAPRQIENVDACLSFLDARGVNVQGLSAEGKADKPTCDSRPLSI